MFGDMVALMVETQDEPVDELAMDMIAAEAIAYAAKKPMFDVRDLPGRITNEERTFIGEAWKIPDCSPRWLDDNHRYCCAELNSRVDDILTFEAPYSIEKPKNAVVDTAEEADELFAR